MVILTPKKRLILSVLITVGYLVLCNQNAFAADETNANLNRVAIKGYDTVAYFTEGRAIKGKSGYSYTWNSAKWFFTHPGNRDLFAKDPERYAPQFGGHCATGLSKGKLVAADPEQWTIVDGKLYMKIDRIVRDNWRQNKTVLIGLAEKNWVKLNN